MLFSVPVNLQPLTAQACEGEVVIRSDGPGRAVCLAMTPEAVLASLEPLRAAAEAALLQTEAEAVRRPAG